MTWNRDRIQSKDIGDKISLFKTEFSLCLATFSFPVLEAKKTIFISCVLLNFLFSQLIIFDILEGFGVEIFF